MTPPQTLYERIGAAEGIERLVSRYLDILQSDPQCAPLRARYTQGFERYRRRMVEYLSGFFGGPALYIERHGLPALRENHQSIPISAQMRDLWYGCMLKAIGCEVADPALRGELKAAFWQMADSLRNC